MIAEYGSGGLRACTLIGSLRWHYPDRFDRHDLSPRVASTPARESFSQTRRSRRVWHIRRLGKPAPRAIRIEPRSSPPQEPVKSLGCSFLTGSQRTPAGTSNGASLHKPADHTSRKVSRAQAWASNSSLWEAPVRAGTVAAAPSTTRTRSANRASCLLAYCAWTRQHWPQKGRIFDRRPRPITNLLRCPPLWPGARWAPSTGRPRRPALRASAARPA
jgi:hypothetical protein